MTEELVSVVIPAFNAAETIHDTLLSVRSQSHRNLEILVVDDGSTDQTATIVERHAAKDGRIRLLRQENAGVARARNHGAEKARADLLAFVDADDLWAPEKIRRQVEVLRAGGPEIGLVYSWYVVIDEKARILEADHRAGWTGDVFARLLRSNFIGNGSAVLVRRSAFDAAGGFEPALADSEAGGCEDILFYCRVAEHCRFAVARFPDIGYRVRSDSMSSNAARMLRSQIMVRGLLLRRYPDHRAELDEGVRLYAWWLISRSLRAGRLLQAASLMRLLGSRRDLGWSTLIPHPWPFSYQLQLMWNPPPPTVHGKDFEIGVPDDDLSILPDGKIAAARTC